MTKRRRQFPWFAALLALLVPTLPAADHQIPLRQMTGQTERIVLGTVINTSSYWGDESRIYTDVLFSPEIALKGAVAGPLTIRVQGGVVGDAQMTVSDEPEFTPGERALVFLRRAGNRYEVAGRDAGKVPLAEASGIADEVLQILETTGGRVSAGTRGELAGYLRSATGRELAPRALGTTTTTTTTCYGQSGVKWPQNQALYKVDTSIPASWAASIAAATQTWNNSGANFTFLTDNSTTNLVSYLDLVGKYGSSYQNVFAVTTTWSTVSTKQITRNTLEVNTYFTWSTTGEANKADVQNILTHEFGHWLTLNDLYSPAACSEVTMWGYAGLGETKKRTIEQADIDGAVSLYGTRSSSLPAPVLASPANGATGVATNTALTWKASAGATSYDVYFGAVLPVTPVNVTGTSYQPAGLAAGTLYQWKVVAKSASASAASAVWSFTTVPAAPAAPTPLTPANQSAGVALTASLTWAASTTAASYDVYFGTSSAPPQVASGLTGTSYKPASLAASTTYYWKVVARNTAGSTASAVWSFTTAAATAPASFALLSPANNATGVTGNPVLAWSAVSGASTYDVYISTAPSPGLAGSIKGTSAQVMGTRANTVYYWKVIAHVGSSTVSSDVWSFKTK